MLQKVTMVDGVISCHEIKEDPKALSKALPRSSTKDVSIPKQCLNMD